MLRQLSVTEELDDHFQLIRWDAFLPSWGSYDVNTTSTDWESVVARFNHHYDELNAKIKLIEVIRPYKPYFMNLLANKKGSRT